MELIQQFIELTVAQNKSSGESNMSDTPNAVPVPVPPTQQAQLKDIEAIRDLFARAHDYIAQASHPGHLGGKVAEVLNFLAFQYTDFKTRGENLAKQIEATVKAEMSKVDVPAAMATTEAVLAEKAAETPKA